VGFISPLSIPRLLSNLQTVAIARPSLARLRLGQRLTMAMSVAMAMAVAVAAPMARHDMIVAAAETVALHPTVAVPLAIAMHTTRTCTKLRIHSQWICCQNMRKTYGSRSEHSIGN